jgi:lipoprotein-anchoring transpeptidase ErfK/SrfK
MNDSVPSGAVHCSFRMFAKYIGAVAFSAAIAAVAVCLPVSGAGARELVTMKESYPMGAIVVSTSERRLYYSLGNNVALRYAVAVGRQGAQWSGETFVQGKAVNPGWTPTANMRRRNPYLPRHVRGGTPENPLGVRAIYLGWSEYRIHGTNAPGSIGTASSSGCIRMHNADVKDLFERVHIGAPVYVLR